MDSIFDNQTLRRPRRTVFQKTRSDTLEFTKSKTRAIYVSHLLAAFIPAAGTVYDLLKHVPHETLYWIQLSGSAGLTILVLSFPTYWMLFPRRHPVHRALAAHGDASALAGRLNEEMGRGADIHRPFYFTSSFLVYSPGYTLDVVPYKSILSALKEMNDSGDGPAAAVVVVHTKEGRTYDWHRTWFQGMFDADRVLVSIRRHANLTQKIGDVYYRTSAGGSDKSQSAG